MNFTELQPTHLILSEKALIIHRIPSLIGALIDIPLADKIAPKMANSRGVTTLRSPNKITVPNVRPIEELTEASRHLITKPQTILLLLQLCSLLDFVAMLIRTGAQ